MSDPYRAIVLLSGGMDSSTVLAEAMSRERQIVLALGFTYGSKHNPFENEAARKVAEKYGVPFQLMDLSHAFRGFRSALMAAGGQALPTGHYEQETMRQTVVPGRNTIFTSIAAGLAESIGAKEIWLGIHAGDHFIYPDCRPNWLESVSKTIALSSSGAVFLVAPFLHQTKVEIIQRGRALDVPYEMTRTCYSFEHVACGKCGSCQERLAAFAANDLVDPLPYLSRELLPKT